MASPRLPGCPIIPTLGRSGGASLGGLLLGDGSGEAAPWQRLPVTPAISHPSFLFFPHLIEPPRGPAPPKFPHRRVPVRAAGGDPSLLVFFSYGAGDLGDAPAAAIRGGYMFRREMINRAMHAAARGGDLEILRELLKGCSDAAAYQDAQGAAILHAAAARGQVEVSGKVESVMFREIRAAAAVPRPFVLGHLLL